MCRISSTGRAPDLYSGGYGFDSYIWLLIVRSSKGRTWDFGSQSGGSNPSRTTYKGHRKSRVAAIAADCKSALFGVRRFESYLFHKWCVTSVMVTPRSPKPLIEVRILGDMQNIKELYYEEVFNSRIRTFHGIMWCSNRVNWDINRDYSRNSYRISSKRSYGHYSSWVVRLEGYPSGEGDGLLNR